MNFEPRCQSSDRRPVDLRRQRHRSAQEATNCNARRREWPISSRLRELSPTRWRRHLRFTSFALLQVVDAAIEQSTTSEEAHIRINRADRSLTVLGDAVWTQQVLTNLLLNAIRYCPGSEEIQIKLHQDASEAVVTVIDSGPGISERDLAHIFERFYRIDKARTRSDGGSGLGLSICRALMEAQRGSITAESNPGKGSQFSVRLPIGPDPTHPHPSP